MSERLCCRESRGSGVSRLPRLFLAIIMGTPLSLSPLGATERLCCRFLPARPMASWNSEYWRLLTAVVVHADVPHFFSNAIFIVFFTYLLFGYFGFWVFPVLSLTMAALTNYISLLTYSPDVSLIGASVAYWISFRGRLRRMYLLVERSLSLGKRVLRVACLSLLVLMLVTFQANVSYRTASVWGWE